MENLTCKGLSAAHRRMLIKCITEEIGSIPEPVEIEFMEHIRRKQYSSLRAIVRKTIPASLSTLYARMAPRSCWLVWSMIRTKICSRQSSMAIAHRTSQQRLLNTTTLILKNEEDRLCLIGRLELLR